MSASRTHVAGLALMALICAAPHGAAAAPSDVPAVPVSLTGQTLETVGTLAVLHNGRVKPFDSFAREIVSLLAGEPHVGRQDPVATLLAIGADPSAWADARILSVPFRPLREALELEPRATHVSYNQLVETRRVMRMLPPIIEKQERDEKLSMLEQEALDLFDRFTVFTKMMQADVRLVPPATPGSVEWRSVLETPLKTAWEQFFEAIRQGDAGRVQGLAREFRTVARDTNPSAWPPEWRIRLELFYHHARPLAAARAIYGAAILLFLLMLWSPAGKPAAPEKPRPVRGDIPPPLAAGTTGRAPGQSRGPMAGWRRRGMGSAALSLVTAAAVVHAAGIAMRVVIGGRPPVSNFYETMLWLPFVGVVLAIIFEMIYRTGFFGFSAAILAGATLLLADYVPLDASISPVVAVLRSNLWLTVHVLTIVGSYGALALATVLAHVYGVQYCLRAGPETLRALALHLYRTIQVGVVMLAGGIMLGAVWANASWGRYWGWDPKETWALITLLWFIAVLHGRFAGWLTGVGVALSTIAGFFLLLMTYYGVSFYLVGLHSYSGGHAKPLPTLLIAYLIAEIVFIALVGLRALRRSPAS